MANMSYCRFHNTVLSLKECMVELSEAIENGEKLDLSQDEKRAKDRLLKVCHEYIKLAEEEANIIAELEEEIFHIDNSIGGER